MTPNNENQATALSRQVLEAFDNLSGLHPGFRPAHAKGILLSGEFTPSASGASLTRAPHLHRASTPVTVRFSDAGGVPAVPDNDPNASPRGIAIRFHLEQHVHTDIIAHSVDGFPTRTVEEFLEFLRAAQASGPGAAHPSPIEMFLGSHPAALAFVQAPKPMPASFALEAYFGVNAYRFTGGNAAAQFGRYRVRAEGGSEFLDEGAAAEKPPNSLFDEIRDRVAKGPVTLRILVQVAGDGDVVDDATVHWPADRPEVEFGSVRLTRVVDNNQEEQQHIIFDPVPRVDGIDTSGDPLTEPRAAIYLMSGLRRRAATQNE